MRIHEKSRVSIIHIELNENDIADLYEWRSMLDAFAQKETDRCSGFLEEILKAAKPELFRN